MALLYIAVVALVLGLAGARATRKTYVVLAVVTLSLSYYAFTR